MYRRTELSGLSCRQFEAYFWPKALRDRDVRPAGAEAWKSMREPFMLSYPTVVVEALSFGGRDAG